MNFDRVINGIVKYMDKELYNNMNSLQEFGARLAVARIVGNKNLKDMLINNPYIKTFAIIDEDGNVDVEGLYRDMKSLMQMKGKLEVTIPLFDTFTFNEADVDCLYNCIMGS
jgi:hypothetical protein